MIHIYVLLTMPFTLTEFKNAISSRSSAALYLDYISLLLMKNIPLVGLLILLSTVNKIWNSGLIPDSWKAFHVIPFLK